MDSSSPKILYVTTFNHVLYEKSGKALIQSYCNHITNGNLLVCYEGFEYDAPSSLTTGQIFSHNLEENEFMTQWLEQNKSIIPVCYGGDASENDDIFKDTSSDFWDKDGQTWANMRASRYFRKIVALHYALETYSDQYDIIYIIDSDCIFKADIPVSIASELFQPSTGMIYFWGKFRRNISRGPETGFTGYCKQTGGFSIARLVCDCFETGKFKQYKYWDDGYVIGQVINEYNSGKLPKSFTQSDSLNISTLKDLVSESQYKTTRVMEIPTNILFPYIHHFKNSHKTSL
jgi:hypothetical protein